ncbi:hypothetical protein [Photobacterium damselae]|uniref:hypothetical protein n=1 Tax=Photobacterium damselae TaxID=38293 RepID=UPI000D660A04|nr:hypothetical protein [Photobacterium damselae]AWK83574.1 hypothetical protein BST98_16255 [Photobacterium damselae]
MLELPILDTSKQDWAYMFLANADSVSTFVLPATISGKCLSEYIAGLGNTNGGYILVGTYSDFGHVTGFNSVSSVVIEDAKSRLESVRYFIEKHEPRFQQIYLIKVYKSESIAFSDGKPFTIKNGKPIVMSKKTLLNQLGLGVDSALINMLSEQITKQSLKLDEQSEKILRLTEELKEKSKLKNQLLGLIVGGVIGALIGWVLSIGLNKLFGLS